MTLEIDISYNFYLFIEISQLLCSFDLFSWWNLWRHRTSWIHLVVSICHFTVVTRNQTNYSIIPEKAKTYFPVIENKSLQYPNHLHYYSDIYRRQSVKLNIYIYIGNIEVLTCLKCVVCSSNCFVSHFMNPFLAIKSQITFNTQFF